jgi:hypothetical protein
MRAVTVAIAVVVLAITTPALAADGTAQCGAPPSIDPFAPSRCIAYGLCDAALCACTDSTSDEHSAGQCLAMTSVSCAAAHVCVTEYVQCLMALQDLQSSADNACNATGGLMMRAVLAATVGGYSGSALDDSCHYRVCEVLTNATRIRACATNSWEPCTLPVNTDPPATPAPAVALTIQFRLSGEDWEVLLASPISTAQLDTALKHDLGVQLAVEPDYLVKEDLSIGSLRAQYSVVVGSGRSVAQLRTALAAAKDSTLWLASTKAVYATVSTETIELLEMAVVDEDSEAPTTVSPPSMPTDEPSNIPTTSTDVSSASQIAVAGALVLTAVVLS